MFDQILWVRLPEAAALDGVAVTVVLLSKVFATDMVISCNG
jgi:hypothetical protein